MNLVLPVILVLQVLAAADADSACERASYLLYNRHLNQTWFDSARTIVAGVRQRDPGNETGITEKRAWYTKARAVADTLRRRSPENPDGHMWRATARGKIGQIDGIVSSAYMIGDLKQSYQRVIELDSGYALAWYALGRLYAALPPLLGGSLNLAKGYLRRGLAADSNHTVIRLELARVYLRQRRRTEARRELHTLLATVQPTDPAEFTLSDQPAALKLLNSIKAAHCQPSGS
jgi:tetratricopeptide (TPR) repeat protein